MTTAERPRPQASQASTDTPRRGPVFGAKGAIATDHPSASLAGINVLQRDGSAIDATIAAAAVNVVTKPQRTHLGGDAFALIWHKRTGAVECLNAGGRAPQGATPNAFPNGMPAHGARASTVPGLVDSWVTLHERHGRRPFAELFEPAIELAERGFPVSEDLAPAIAALADRDIVDDATRTAFLDDGRPYDAGELLRQPELAETLRRIASDGRDGFYAGATGEAIVAAMTSSDGLIDRDDLAQPTAHWHDPLTISYRDCTVYEQALPSQGIILLEALNIVEQFPLADWGACSADAAHVMIEATRQAFADVRRYADDPLVEKVDVDRLLSKDHARARAAEIDLERATERGAAPAGSDTTSFVVADEDVAVSYIQSIYWPWGSGVTIPGTGIVMNNRMLCFRSDRDKPNCVAPGKRAVHTLNTFLVVRDGELVAGGGTPGADFQVQNNLQTVVGAVDWGLGVDGAVDLPRWIILPDGRVRIEGRYGDDAIAGLQARGHTVQRARAWDTTIARSQVVASTPAGGWAAASDLRGEGVALAI